tara:strand:+ start:393 stop:1013 length:621 start_codon:yes stop_codon:yes gene_type:complete
MRYDIPHEFKPFLTSVKRQCKSYGIDLVLSPSRNVVLTDDLSQDCSGYFCDRDKELVVACGRPFKDWFEVLIHEFSHMEQWKSDDRWDGWTNSCGKTWEWMSGNTIMNKIQINGVLDNMVELEKDCEMRAVEKIRQWNLPIPIGRYIQKANIYLYSYYLLPRIKKFPTGIYTDNTLVDLASKKFKKSYREVPEDIKGYILNKFDVK